MTQATAQYHAETFALICAIEQRDAIRVAEKAALFCDMVEVTQAFNLGCLGDNGIELVIASCNKYLEF